MGESEATATSLLQEKGFVVDVAYDNSSSYNKGVVMEQSKTGTAEKGSTVRIVVSLGRGTVEVPNVIGYDQDSAEEILADAGFSVNVTTQASDSAAGTVISQSVSGTVSADSVHTITITVSTGPDPTEEVPGTGGGTGGGGTGSIDQ